MTPEQIVNEVKKPLVCWGRGGAGFLARQMWASSSQAVPSRSNLICNADESEAGHVQGSLHHSPGSASTTGRDDYLLFTAVNARLTYIYIRGEFPLGARILEQAIAEARSRGYIGSNIFGSGFDLEIYVHRGAGA